MTKTTEAELRGRIMTLETVMMTLLAHMAAHTDNPVLFGAQVMENAESMLRRATDDVPEEMEETAAFALTSFGNMSAQLLAHFNRYAVPKGQG